MADSGPQTLPMAVRDSELTTHFEHDVTVHTESGRRQERWVHEKVLGRGGYGVVHLQRSVGDDPNGPKQSRAVKVIGVGRYGATSAKTSDYVLELQALAKFSSIKYVGSFVKFLGWYEHRGLLHIATEYLNHGDLGCFLERKGSVPENEACVIASQILFGLSYMHQEGFAHRDLKPQNIFIKEMPPGRDWWIKIGDLGLSKQIENTSENTSETVCGTPNFMPPEMLNHSGSARNANLFLGDMWSLGETIFRLLSNKPAFHGENRIFYGLGIFHFPSNILEQAGASATAIDLICALMHRDPTKRPRPNEALGYAWLKRPADIRHDNNTPKPSEIISQSQEDIVHISAMATDHHLIQPPSASWTGATIAPAFAIDLTVSDTRLVTMLVHATAGGDLEPAETADNLGLEIGVGATAGGDLKPAETADDLELEIGVGAKAIRKRDRLSSKLASFFPPQGGSTEEIKQGIRAYIGRNGLDRFLPSDGCFFDILLNRALKTSPEPSALGSRDLARLASYQPILYCDDSSSMISGWRIERQTDMVKRITAITSRLIPDGTGVKLRFINAPTAPEDGGYLSKSDVVRIVEATTYCGKSEIGTNLEGEILQPMVYDAIRDGTFHRPLLVSIITHGCSRGTSGSEERKDSLQSAVKKCRDVLREHNYDPEVVRFHIIQIGNDPEAQEFLDALLEDHVHFTTDLLGHRYRKIQNDITNVELWIMQLLLSFIINAELKSHRWSRGLACTEKWKQCWTKK